jgi:hypothetical protein
MPMQPIKNLNSSDSYLSAIHYIRRIEKEVESAEQGNPSMDFQEQLQAVLDLQAVIKARTAEGGIPLHLQSVHRILEESLQELSTRVETVSKKLGISSSQLSIEDETDPPHRSTLWAKISLGSGLAGAAALFYGLLWPAKPTNIASKPGTPQNPSAEADGKTPDSAEVTSEPVPEKQPDSAPQAQNSNQPDVIEPSSSAKSSKSLPAEEQLNLKRSEAGGCQSSGCPTPFFPSISNMISSFALPDCLNSQISSKQSETIRNADPSTFYHLPISSVESFIDENFDEEKQTSTEVPNDGALTIWPPNIFGQRAKSPPVHEPVPANPIAGHVRNLASLGELFFARYALNSAAPMLGLAAAHRLYHLVELSGASKELKSLMPQLAEGMEKAANLYSGFEAILPVSTSAMLESMMSLDRWALVGLMELVRNAPGVQGAIAPIPFLSFFVQGQAWNLIKFSPFLVPLLKGNAHSWLFSSKEDATNLLLENTTRSDQSDDKIRASYSRDLAYLAYIYLTGRALNTMAPMLTLAAVHHGYEIIRLCNVTEELRPHMPLLAEGAEKISSLYSRISGVLPFSPSNMLESLTNMNAWAMVGLMDLVRNVLGVSFLTVRVPFLHSLHSDWRWKLFRFAPLLLGGILPQAPLGNFQALLPR